MWIKSSTATLLVFATTVAFATAQDYQIVKVSSVAGAAVDSLKPKTIFFTDHRADEKSDKGAFIRFEDWLKTVRSRPSTSTSFRASGKAWCTRSSTARRKR
jgi:hypothetical protein